MKILQVNNFFYRRGGADVVFLNTIDLLATHGHKVISFSRHHPQNRPSDYSRYFIPNGNIAQSSKIRQLWLSLSYFYSQTAKRQLEKLLREEKPEVAHLHNFYGGLTSAILPVLKRHGLPVVATVHDYKLLCPAYLFLDGQNEICERCRGRRYYHCVGRKCVRGDYLYSLAFALESAFRDKFVSPCNYIDRFIFVSRFALQKHIEFKPELKQKAIHLFNFAPSIKQNYIAQNEGYYLYAGRLSREKGLHAFLKLAEIYRDSKFVIAGDGPLHDTVVKTKPANVDYLGHLVGEKLSSLVRQAAFLVVPSEWYENNPMNIVEAYAGGTPVIAAEIGGISEIVVENKTGFLFKPGDAGGLAEAFEKAMRLSNEQYARLATEAINFANTHFNRETYYNQLMKIYASN